MRVALTVLALATACRSSGGEVAPQPVEAQSSDATRGAAMPHAPASSEPKQPTASAEAAPGMADTDPDNDEVVAPPDPIAECEQALAELGVRYRAATLPLRTQRSGAQCGAPQVVVYERGPGDIRYDSPPLLTCGMALALARFEHVIQQEAQRALGQRVTRITQMGTYSCRKMVRFRMVSEHSYANAIDLEKFVLADRTVISVKRHYGDARAEAAASRFLQTIARRAYEDGIFSVALGPPWDRLHANHLHLDLARYRVNGTFW
jgi:hypothetical protein